MDGYIGKTCPFCMSEIKEGDTVKICPVCGTPHHAACWEKNKGCTTSGCPEKHCEPQETKATNVCAKCGAILDEGQNFCPNCGHRVESIVNPTITAKNGQIDAPFSSKKKKALIPIIAGVAIIAVIIIAIVTSSSRVNLKKVYDEIGGDGYCCTISSDGSCLQIDTNPSDIDDFYSDSAWKMVEKANEVLGLPDSLEEKMEDTTALDGRQTEKYDNVTVSWKYHPDNGLEVIYEKNN